MYEIWPCITPIMKIIFSNILPNSKTVISKLDTVYRYTVFNGKPVYGIFYTHIAYNKMVYQIIFAIHF